MPKATKSPVKPRPKPRPVRSPKKLDATLVDDQAVESDDGVVVNRPDLEVDQQNMSDQDEDHLVTASDLDGYDTDFINDGLRSDPFDEGNHSGGDMANQEITPPPSQFKKASELPLEDQMPSGGRARAALKARGSDISPVKVKRRRDMEAMDQDDMLLLEPPLSGLMQLEQAKAAPEQKKINVEMPSLTDIPLSLRQPPFVVDGKITDTLLAVVAAFAANKPEQQPEQLVIGPGDQSADNGETDGELELDHDQLALEEGIRSSLGLPAAPNSPDWDPPYAGELVEEAFTQSPAKRRHSADVVPKRSSRRSTAVMDDESGSDAAEASPPKKVKSTAFQVDKGKGKYPASAATKISKRSAGGSSATKKSTNTSSRAKNPDALVSSYMKEQKKPVVAASVASPGDEAPLTMAQLLRVTRGEPAGEADDDPKHDEPSVDGQPVFLEDLETYKAYFDPDAPCGVNDIELQDPSLRPHYVGLPPLPKGRRVLPAYDKDRVSLEEIDWSTGGRIKFSSWFDQNPRMLAANSMGAMLFQSADPNYINLSRVSPLELSSRVSGGSSQTSRMHVGDRIAICVSERKWFSGVFHDQDWERFESITSLVFGDPIMYGQMQDKAISFQTMICPDLARAQCAYLLHCYFCKIFCTSPKLT
ncbi:hypothetical protein C8R46DRAFT_1038268 [Mycena filopes]|nr:hypothetical protein C8R46DRAFT_1038268 [Mycena filopes]